MATSTSHLAEIRPSRLWGLVRGWRRIAAAALAVAAVVGFALVGLHSSLFHVRHIEVGGTSELTRQEVVRLSGVTTAANVFSLDTRAVERRLETDPWVARATVSRSLPWTVRIEIAERQPVGVTIEDGAFRLIAGDGTSLGEASVDPRLPAIVLPPPWGAYVPPSVAGPAEALAGLDGRIRSKVQRAVVAVDGTIELFLTDGLRIEYGDATRIAAKSRALLDVLRWARTQGRLLRSVNVLAPDAPAATFAP